MKPTKGRRKAGSLRFSVRQITKEGTTLWQVQGYKVDRSRVRSLFKTSGEATAEADRLNLEAEGEETTHRPKQTNLSDKQLREAEWCFHALEGRPLRKAVEFFLENYRESEAVCSVRDAYNRFLEELENAGKRPHTIRDLRTRVGHLVDVLGDKPVHEVLPQDITPVIELARGRHKARGLRSRHNQRNKLHRFFEWCRKQRYCPSNPVAGTVEVDLRELNDQPPHILTAKESERLINFAASFKDARLLPYVALSLFAAVRPTELQRLGWGDVDLARGSLLIGKTVAKTKQEREVALSKNAVAWLKLVAGKRPPIKPANFQRDFDTLKTHIGYGSPTKENPSLKPWQQDTLRHTAASFHFAKHKSEGRTASWCGNSVAVLRTHYKRLIRHSAEVRAFWNIHPPKATDTGKIIQLSATA